MSANSSAHAVGYYTFDGQCTWDQRGVPLLVDYFKALHAKVLPCQKLEMQKRGVDLIVSTQPRSTRAMTTVDAKIDTQGGAVRADGSPGSRNMTLELVSRCRFSMTRAGAVLGWPYKDMNVVAYFFAHTGEVLLLNMRKVYPWLHARVKRLALRDRHAFKDVGKHFFSYTPNDTYLSFNLVADAQDFLLNAPGVAYFKVTDVITPAEYEARMGVTLQAPFIRSVPAAQDASGARIFEFFQGLENYYVREEQLSPLDSERLIRFLSEEAPLPRNPKYRDNAVRLRDNRPRLTLPEDRESANAPCFMAEG